MDATISGVIGFLLGVMTIIISINKSVGRLFTKVDVLDNELKNFKAAQDKEIESLHRRDSEQMKLIGETISLVRENVNQNSILIQKIMIGAD